MSNDNLTWNIIWQLDPEQRKQFIELDWFRFLFAQVPVESARVDWDGKPLLSAVIRNPIVVASCPNLMSEEILIEYLQKLPRPRVLYHLSDEYVKVGASLYRHCDLVIRNGSALFDAISTMPILQIPLGYGVGFENLSGLGLPASQREYSWTFMGTMKQGRREEMLPALQTLPGNQHIHETTSWSESLQRFNDSSTLIYRQSVFVPCPKGNWNPECNRLYDALEWGCIPLIHNYTDTPYRDGYHTKLLGKHPLPEFDSWEKCANFAGKLLDRPERLNELQRETYDWWQNHKINLRNELNTRLAKLLNTATNSP